MAQQEDKYRTDSMKLKIYEETIAQQKSELNN
jgi:hypothetical protein